MGKKGGTIRKKQIPGGTAMNKQTENAQQSTRIWIKLTVLLVIVFSTAALLTTYVVMNKLRETNKNLQQQALELEEGNQDLQDYIDHQNTDEGVQDVAKDDLGMVDPDTIIYIFD